jgi:L-amino acid N-acyltransferase YncA
MKPTIETMNPDDWDQVRSIYLEGISTRNATFETEVPEWEQWDASHLPHSRLVARSDDSIVGWAALSPVSRRRVYAGVAEVSVYVRQESIGQGVGGALLNSLISSSEENGIWTLQAGIFPENAASIALHVRWGFREVGRREGIGKMDDIWRDTLLFERRSNVVGAD